MGGAPKPEWKKKAVIKDYLDGVPMDTIIKKYQYSRSGVHALLKDRGIPVRYPLKRNPTKHPLEDEIIKDYLAGYTYKLLWKKYKINNVSLRKILIRNNIPLRGKVGKIRTLSVWQTYATPRDPVNLRFKKK